MECLRGAWALRWEQDSYSGRSSAGPTITSSSLREGYGHTIPSIVVEFPIAASFYANNSAGPTDFQKHAAIFGDTIRSAGAAGLAIVLFKAAAVRKVRNAV